MNRLKAMMSKKLSKKKNKKEVHKAQKEYVLPASAPVATSVKSLLAKYPKKLATKDQELLSSMEKGFSVKKKKAKAPHTKRTTPGEVGGRVSSPRHAHMENERWIGNLTMQNKVAAKRIVKKALKK